jgi:L-threonylcarbamoyladenylate synthase
MPFFYPPTFFYATIFSSVPKMIHRIQYSHNDIRDASAHIRAGRLVALPTETVYGLGANALDDHAVAAIYAAKERPSFNPLIVHVATIEQAKKYVVFNALAEKCAAAFWPGSLTLVLPRSKDCPLSLLVSAGLDSVAIRMPNHPLALALLTESGLPIAAPSANKSGRVSPTTAAHVAEELAQDVAMILDGGACTVGVESTVLDMTGDVPVLLRPGGVTQTQLEAVIGKISLANDGVMKSPGMMESHYAPNATIRLNVQEAGEGEVLLAFGNEVSGALNLSPSGNLQEAAANLFAMLRALDKTGAKTIAVMTIPEEGLGVAINDRLRRAAAPR